MYKSGTREQRITIRIPAALKTALEREARRDRRSVADIIIPVLEVAFLKVVPGKAAR
ncbi:MAG TPA: hypothetical protein VGF94_02525 [Kofleriaceae bacterium]